MTVRERVCVYVCVCSITFAGLTCPKFRDLGETV